MRPSPDKTVSAAPAVAAPPVLKVQDLHVSAGDLHAVRGVSFTLQAGQRMGLVGESGAGKSLTALAVMGLLPSGWRTEGSVQHDGSELTSLSDRAFSRRRGRTLSMVFQDPLSALNPTRRIGDQITSVIRRHTSAGQAEARRQAIELLDSMNLPRPESMMRSYPHQLSGGQRQRIMIAIALACYPQLIIADEPTTALDVTVQKQVLRLLDNAVTDRGCALLMITHALPVIAAMCDSVAVMYGGRIVEAGPVAEVFTRPRHHYTRGLLESQPTMDNIALDGSSRLPSIPGMVPALQDMPTGCAFRTRCAAATDQCAQVPRLTDNDETGVACWHPLPHPTVQEAR